VNAPLAIGFDFDHTLGLDHGLEIRAFELLGAERGVPFDAEIVKRELTRYRAGEQSMQQMFEACGGDGLTRRWETLCLELVAHVTPIDGAREVLAALAARGIPTAILTNGWSPLQEGKVAQALAFSGPVLVSEKIGVRKPERAAFEQLATALGTEITACWYVGDNPDADIVGAHAAGMRSVWFDWENVAYPAGAPPPFARIGSLRELLTLVPGHGASAQNAATSS
jgi:HAD superfamily hydrolase (TIGR01509 family)